MNISGIPIAKTGSSIEVDAQTQLFAVLAGNSRSSGIYPLYNAGFKTAGYNGIYIPIDVDEDIKNTLDSLISLGFRGAGIGVPFKVAIMPYVNELVGDASRIGAINYVVFDKGRVVGGNTDGLGALKALKEKTTVSGKKVILVGAGGMAKAIMLAVSDEGGRLFITNRTPEKASDLAKRVNAQTFLPEELPREIQDAQVVINATTLGMKGIQEKMSAIPKDLLKPGLIVQDVVSVPRETQLIIDAKEKGCIVVPARRTSLWQAVLKFQPFTGIKPDGTIIAAMEKAFN
ncbi:MAG: shikimate dehydrogenase [Patescibacteria group bacterium]